MSSDHLLLGRPLYLCPLLRCDSVQCIMHLLSFILAICRAHLHVCISVCSVSNNFVLFLISEHGILSYSFRFHIFLSFCSSSGSHFVCQLFIRRPCLAAIGHCWQVCLLVGCLMSQQHACVSQGRICSDNFTCCHTEIEVADPTFYLTQSQYTDTGPTSPSADPITPGAWQGSHWSANF